MQRSTDHILTTHTGSLPRGDAVLEGMRAREEERLVDPAALEACIEAEVTAVVARQVEAGIDVVNDGECGRPNFHHYVGERLSGFERRVPPGGVPVLTRPLGIGGRDAAIVAQTRSETFRSAVAKLGQEPLPAATAELVERMQRNHALWAGVVKATGFQAAD